MASYAKRLYNDISILQDNKLYSISDLVQIFKIEKSESFRIVIQKHVKPDHFAQERGRFVFYYKGSDIKQFVMEGNK